MAVMAEWGTGAYTGRGAYSRSHGLQPSDPYSDQYEQKHYHPSESSYTQGYTSSQPTDGYYRSNAEGHSYQYSQESNTNSTRDYQPSYSSSSPSAYQKTNDYLHHGHTYQSSSSSQEYVQSHEDGASENMAGFGARKLMEKNRQRLEQAQQERRQREEARRIEEERLWREQEAWEADQRAHYVAMARQQQRENEARRQAGSARSHQDAHSGSDQGRHDQQGRSPNSYHRDQASSSAAYYQDEADSKAAAQQWYQQEEGRHYHPPSHQHQQQQHYQNYPSESTVTQAQGSSSARQYSDRTTTPASAFAQRTAVRQSPSATGSQNSTLHHRTDTGGSSIAGELPYDRHEQTSALASIDENAVFNGTGSATKAPTDSPTLSLAQRNAARETVYEDDFEEADEELAVNLARYTQYEGGVDAEFEDKGKSGAWAGARKSLFRATMYEPVPKARCADCGESFSFEELAEHACEQASLPGTPTLSLTPLQSSAPLPESAAPDSGGRAKAGSPFLDRYEELHGKKSPQRSPLLGHLGGPTRSASTDESYKSRQLGRLGLGLNMGDEMTRSQTSPIGSPLSDIGKAQQQGSDQDSAQALTTAEIRKRIEAQRAAKRQNTGLVPLTQSPTDTFKKLELEKSPSGVSPTTAKPPTALGRDLKPSPAVQRNPSETSTSSSIGTQSSSLLAPGSSPVSLALTPSSSVDCFSEYASSSPPRTDLLSPKSAQLAWDRMSSQEKSACITEARKQQQQQRTGPTASPLLTAGAKKSPSGLPVVPPSLSPRVGRSPRAKEVDLGGIEDLLKDLETSDVAPTSASRKEAPMRQTPTKGLHSRDTHGRETPTRRQPPPTALNLSSDSKPRRKPRSTKLCCVCMCSLSSSKTRFVEKDGKYFCAEDYKQLYLPKCSKCRQPVEKDAVRSRDGALKGVFHRSCFCCFRCDARFEDGIFYIFENAPRCFSCYSTLAGTLCASCGLGIEGVCRQTENGERYHPHCLTCQFENYKTKEFCQDILEDFYTMAGRRLCEHHAQKVQKMLDKVGKKKAKAEKRRTMLKTLAAPE